MSLADDIIAACRNPAKQFEPRYAEPPELRKLGAWVNDRVRSARRFYLTPEVVEAATLLGIEHPDVLYALMPRARAPFERVWIEWDPRVQAEVQGREAMEGAAERTGVLIERMDEERPLHLMSEIGRITLVDGEPSRTGHFALSGIGILYDLAAPIHDAGGRLPSVQGVKAEFDFGVPAGFTSEAARAALLLGSAYYKTRSDRSDEDIPEQIQELLAGADVKMRAEQCERIAQHAAFVSHPATHSMNQRALAHTKLGPHVHNLLLNQLREQAGTFRFIVSLLALINARDLVETVHRRDGDRRFVGGKFVPFLEHLLVSLKLPRRLAIERMIRSVQDSLPKRRHEVIGHWKHSRSKGDPSCDHVFVDETPSRQRCAVCGFKRWWVNEHYRGDGSVGLVIKDRLVERRS